MLLDLKSSTLPDKTCVIQMESADFYSLPCLVKCSSVNSELCVISEINCSTLTESYSSTVFARFEMNADVSNIYINLPVHVFGNNCTVGQSPPAMHYSSNLASCLLASERHPQWIERCNSDYWPWDPGIHKMQ